MREIKWVGKWGRILRYDYIYIEVGRLEISQHAIQPY